VIGFARAAKMQVLIYLLCAISVPSSKLSEITAKLNALAGYETHLYSKLLYNRHLLHL
jgi:hypothetical protein